MMRRLLNSGLKGRIIVASLLATLLPLAVIAVIAVVRAESTIENLVSARLAETGDMRKKAIIEHLEGRFGLLALSHGKSATTGLARMQTYLKKGGLKPDKTVDVTSETFKKVSDDIALFYKYFKEECGINDIMLVTADGYIVYSLTNESDLGTNLLDGSFKNTGLAKLFRRVLAADKAILSDYYEYSPAGGVAISGAVPVYDDSGKSLGALVVEFDPSRIESVMRSTGRAMRTETCYLVGNDRLVRTSSSTTGSAVASRVKMMTAPVAKALEGGSGVIRTVSADGTPVLASYDSLGLKQHHQFNADFDWLIVTEIDESEAFAQLAGLVRTSLWGGLLLAVLVVLQAFGVANWLAKPIRRVAGQLAGAANDISLWASHLAAAATQSAAAVQETAATVEEVRQTAAQASDRARTVAEAAQQTVEVSRRGLTSVEETNEGMLQIRRQVETITEGIVQLSEQSRTIGDIIQAVDEIAEQSNLLAVNAALQAAKAGEQGKGFGVVANEIRILAQRSKQATQQVRSILDDVQRATSKAVMSTEQGGKAVEAGLVQSRQAGEAINILAENIDEATRAAMQIAASSAQQSAGIDQVMQAMDNINASSSQNVASTNQLQDAAFNLNQMSKTLRQVIDGA